MISDLSQIILFFEELSNHVNKSVHFYVIGGAMLMHKGLKRATKDIDVIVDDKDEYIEASAALKHMGFSPNPLTNEYCKLALNSILQKMDFRIDLFHRVVCKGFSLSKNMKKRAERIFEKGLLSVSVCSGEDVFLFKSFTEREGDIDDCIALARAGLDWDAILTEVKNQIRHSGKEIWITWIAERLDILEERGIAIPIMKSIDVLRKDYLHKLEKTQ